MSSLMKHDWHTGKEKPTLINVSPSVYCIRVALDQFAKKGIRMKNTLISFLMLIALNGYSQSNETSDEQKIKDVINMFFESLASKDSTLLLKSTMRDGQVWRKYNNENPVRIDQRHTKDDLSKMSDWPNLKEVAQEFRIIHEQGIATAWVPYKFWVEGKFSHCGIDVFTLFDMNGQWKIVSTAYTIEKENCKE